MALRKFAFNVASLTLARGLQTVASIVAIPILARFLEPSEFGLIALAMPFILFCMAIGDAGLGQSLVRVKQSETLVWSSAFWLIMALSGGLSLFVLVLAWPYAILFEHPEVAPIVAVLAISPFLQGLTALPVAELQQRERFQLLAATEVIASFAALVSALVLAAAGAGVWALVSQATLYWVVKAISILFASSFRPKLQFAVSALEGHFTFSRDSAISNLVAFFSRQVDPLVIGKMMGAAPLGLYSMANRLAILPAQLLAAPAQNTLYVKMVALRHDIAALRDLVLISSLAVAILVFPPMAIAAVSSHSFFVVFLSAKWADAAILFSILAPVAAIQVVSTIWTPMLLATENTTMRLRMGVELTVLWLVVLPFAAMFGVVAVMVAYVVIYSAFSLLRSFNKFLSPVHLNLIGMTRALAAPLTVSVGAALVHFGLVWVLRLPPLGEVALALAEMVLALALLLLICRRTLKAHVGQLRALFSAAPPLAEGALVASPIKIYVWPLDPTTSAPAAELSTLSEKEVARMARFVFDKDRFRFGQSHARMRALLGAHLGVTPADLAFGENAHGKPLLDGGPFFNLSHSHNLAALAISDDLDLGLDVEHVRAIEGPEIARRFFSPQECAALNAYAGADYENAFYRCWTRKEAYVKAQGEGLGIPLDSFEVTIDAETPPRLLRIDGDDAAAWKMWAFDPAPNYQGAVALRTAEAISFEVITSA